MRALVDGRRRCGRAALGCGLGRERLATAGDDGTQDARVEDSADGGAAERVVGGAETEGRGGYGGAGAGGGKGHAGSEEGAADYVAIVTGDDVEGGGAAGGDFGVS